MTEAERIEAAARALYAQHIDYPANANEWPFEKVSHALMPRAELMLRAAYPELHSSPPTGWIAPWEASEADVQHFVNRRIQDGYAAMRTAHLNPTTTDDKE